MRTVESRVTHVGVHARSHGLNTQFERGQGCEVADSLGRDLIDGNAAAAQIAPRRFRNGRASEPRGGFDVMSITRISPRVPKLLQNEDLLLERLKRRQRFGKFEIKAGAFGRPSLRIHAIGHVEKSHANRMLLHGSNRSRSREKRERFHRFQQWQAHDNAHSLEHFAPRDLP